LAHTEFSLFDGMPKILKKFWIKGIIFKGLAVGRFEKYKKPMYR